jgi:DNA-binding beta-propeller fold protein YncE
MGARRLILSLLGVVLGVLAFASTSAFALEGHVFSSSFGKAGSGADEVELGGSSGVAVDNTTQDVYVADTGNARVDEFEANGTFVRAWGWGVADGLAKAETCTLICEKGLGGSGAGQLTTPTAIAVDNSGGSSEGDVYVADTATNVVDKFSATGEYISSNDGSTATSPIAGPFVEAIAGIAVDGGGHLWVYELSSNMFEFSVNGAFVTDWNSERGVRAVGIAIDAFSDIDVATGAPGVARFSSTGLQIGNIEEGALPTGIGVDTTTGDLFVDEGKVVNDYPSSCEPAQGYCATQGSFGSGKLSGATGIGVNASNGQVYVADTAANRIDVFTSALLPGVVTGEVTDLEEGSATLAATVEPEGEAVTSCEFQYVEESEYEPSAAEPYAKGATAACEPSPASTTVPVEARIKNLTTGALYHYRLVVANKNGENPSADKTFRGGATIDAESISKVESTQAVVGATIDARNQLTTYRVEYGLSNKYGDSTTPADIGQPSGNISVAAHLTGLLPATEYHFRFVVTDSFGSADGSDMILVTTQSSGGTTSAALPDGRIYELVSSAGNPGEVYEPAQINAGFEDQSTTKPFFASADGEAIAYVSEPPLSGGTGSKASGGDDFIAKRNANGWSSSDIMPIPFASKFGYVAFSSDLSQGIFLSSRGHILPSDTHAPAGCKSVLWSRSIGNGSSAPLFTTTQTPEFCGYPVFAGASLDQSQLLFQTEAALVPGTSQAAGPPEGAEEYVPCVRYCNLYDSISGNLQLVNVLPKGEVAPNATFGSSSVVPASLEPINSPNYSEDNRHPGSFSNVISGNGARIFWTDLETGSNMEHIFVRENGTSTVPVSTGAARFWTATPDGHFALYTENETETLWRFDVDSETRQELAGTGAGVQGVIGASSDGAYVYFVATGVLASNENGQKEKALSGGLNLYVYHEGSGAQFVATLSPADDEVRAYNGISSPLIGGDWQPNLGLRTAQITPNGQHLVFESHMPLAPGSASADGAVEIFNYEAATGRISCVSCDPNSVVKSGEEGIFLSVSGQDTYARRVLSEDGERVFFDSFQPLVPQETGQAQGVYEWERESSDGGCREVRPARVEDGCISLLSGVSSGGSDSYFVEADATGDNVFLVSRNQLVGQSFGERDELYDARVDGGFSESSLACTGSGCQGAPPAPPIFATPSSVTFNGVGNLPPPPPPSVSSSKSKKTIPKCARGKKLSHGKCIKVHKSKKHKKSKRAGRARGLKG